MAAARRRGPQPLEHRILLTATLCLLAAGAVMVYSASSARTLLAGQGDGTGYLVRYLAYGAVGLVLMHVLARRSLDSVRRATPLLLGGSFVLLLAVLVPGVGVEVNGARRWLGIGPLQFQPSELMKLAIVLYAAGLIARRPARVRTLRGMASPLLVVCGAAALLVALEPDLGSALVLGGTVAALLVASGVPLRMLGALGGSAAVVVLLYALVEPYRRERLVAFLNPWGDAADSGFQAVQGQIAIGSGGLLGVGPGQSIQKVFYLPEAHTDFILAVIGEELGLAGICGLLFLYGMIGYAGLRAALAARDPYAKLLAAGLTSLILCQALLNTYAVLGLAPLTGVPLPFISSGSSSLIVLLAAMGLLLNVASGGSARLRAVPGPRQRPAGDAGGDRRGRDGRARDPGPRRRRRAAG